MRRVDRFGLHVNAGVVILDLWSHIEPMESYIGPMEPYWTYGVIYWTCGVILHLHITKPRVLIHRDLPVRSPKVRNTDENR